MSVERWAALSTTSSLWTACGSIQQAVVTLNHPHACVCKNCVAKKGAQGARGLHSTAMSHRQSSPKVVRRDDLPAQWPYAGNKREDNRKYQEQMREYKAKVAVLRNAWRPLVDKHRDELIRRKEERDRIRLEAQEKDLARQYDRWKVPTELRTSQQIRSDPDAREYAYARHALRSSLAQVSRVAQAELLLRESKSWVDPKELDSAIEHALDHPTDLFQGGEPWGGTLDRVPEYVEGFEGPHVDRDKPEFLRREKKKDKKDKEKPAPPKPVW